MSISATYVSTTSFTVAEDRRLWFVPGRAVRCDCGVDGVKFGYVSYSSYSSVTTVTLLSSESEALTSNLASVDLSIFRPDSVNTGSAPLEDILMLRGFKTGMALEYKSTTEFYVNVGSIHIDDGTYDRIYQVPSKLTKSVTGLSASTWYHVYAAPPANGLTLTATEITYSTTAPSVDDTKGGKLYHPSDATKRCIGWIYSNSSGNVTPFVMGASTWQFTDSKNDIYGAAPSNTWTTVTAYPIANVNCMARVSAQGGNAAGSLLVRKKGDSGAGNIGPTSVGTSTPVDNMTMLIPTDSSMQFEIKFGTANTCNVYISFFGFVIPSSL